jgi:hypothetical protein
VAPGDQAVLSVSIKASRLASWAHRALRRPADVISLEWNAVPLVVGVCRFPVVYGFARVPAELLPGLAFVPVVDDGARGDSGEMKLTFVWRER